MAPILVNFLYEWMTVEDVREFRSLIILLTVHLHLLISEYVILSVLSTKDLILTYTDL